MSEWAELSELRDALGTEDCLGLIDMFVEETAEILGAFSDQKPLSNLESDLHYVKGCALNLGLRKVAERCVDLEMIAKNAVKSGPLLAELAAEAQRDVSAARQFLEKAIAA